MAATRSASTLRAYHTRAEQLVKRYKLETPGPHSQIGFARFVIGLKPTLAAAAWRQYKAALIAALEGHLELRQSGPPTAHLGTIIGDLEQAIDMLQSAGQRGAASNSGRTSAAKAKQLPPSHRLQLESAAIAARSRWGRPLAAFLRAGVLTGLRPCEWHGSVVLAVRDPGLFVLHVRNAKSDEVRGNGETRTLTFEHLDAEDRTMLIEWQNLALSAEADGNYAKLINGVGVLLRTLSDRLFKGKKGCSYTPYSARHEFAAIAKAAGLSPEEVAALMGHAADDTATKHYGRPRKSARGPNPEDASAIRKLPAADPEEVMRVRRKLDAKRSFLKRDDRIELRSKPGARTYRLA